LRLLATVLFTGVVGIRLVFAALVAAAAFGQQPQWELGASVGYGWYRGVRVNGPGAEAKAGIHSRFAAGAVATEDLYERISGEIRYTYHDGDPFLSLNGRSANIQGQSHAFTYETLFHLRDRDSRLRPNFAAGAGGKYFRATGPEPNPQPGPGAAVLVNTSEWRFVVSVGGGVTWRMPNHLLLRADFRDYISPFARKLIVPAAGATARGLLHQFTPMVGVGFWF
jgi:hypothetical protein